MGSFFQKMPCALQKCLNTRYYWIEKDAHSEQFFSIKRGHLTKRLFADLIILIKNRLMPAVSLNLKH